MRAEKDPKTGKWLIQYRYTDWQGNRKKSTKRGFNTKREAEEWLRSFLSQEARDVDMLFEDFISLYLQDVGHRLREHTMRQKRYMIHDKILPVFGKKKLSEITPVDVRSWQNSLMQQDFSQTYLRSINNQLSAIFNYAVKYYDLPKNPCHKAGSMGKKRTEEMNFWTKPEYLQFAEAIMDKPMAYYAFEVLYWCGIREGELLALTAADIDLGRRMLSVTKSYQRLGGRDVITPPKTEKSIRQIKLPAFLCDELQDYMKSIYGLKPDDRIFPVTKHFLSHEMQRGCKASGVKKIRIHDLRHSHVSLLIEMHFPPTAIADRLGHETIDITLHYAHMFPSRQDEMAERLDIERMNKNNDEPREGK